MNSRKRADGRLEYEIEPDRWCSRQRVNQLRNRVAHRARIRLGIAINKTASIKRQPCMHCGRRAEAHHDDYQYPYKVTWLCRKHHNQHKKPQLLKDAPLDLIGGKPGRPKGVKNFQYLNIVAKEDHALA